jgi:hypothetical protein
MIISGKISRGLCEGFQTRERVRMKEGSHKEGSDRLLTTCSADNTIALGLSDFNLKFNSASAFEWDICSLRGFFAQYIYETWRTLDLSVGNPVHQEGATHKNTYEE